MMKFGFSAICLCLSLSLSSPAIADDKAKQQQELKALQSKIKALQKTIAAKQNSKSAYVQQLKKIEKNISSLNQTIRSTKNKITDKKRELKKLNQEKKTHQKQLSRESGALEQQVYSAYTLGEQEKIKLLFSQQSGDEFQRNLIYYQYFLNARLDLIDQTKANIDKILKTEAIISEVKQSLENNHQKLKDQNQQLKKDRVKRQTVIASLDKQLKNQGGTLGKLQADAQSLQSLINSIDEVFIQSPEPQFKGLPFAQLKGRLAWPVKGKLRRLFAIQKQQSSLRWQGVLIEAPIGRHVRAVSSGRVAFADWLRGFGNIIIIDHGHSYLSLYGHNESLFKSAGEWVETGDIISSVGNSGGQKKSAVYFEIRKKGKPLNPTNWCKADNSFIS